MSDTIVKTMPLEPIWQTPDPFLFCAHHLDFYPKANAQWILPVASAGLNRRLYYYGGTRL
jgi:hypothetical protein